MNKELLRLKENWKEAWKDTGFRIKFISIWGILAVLVLILMPPFFTHIQNKPGVQMNDPILSRIGPIDISVFTFGLIWFMALYASVMLLFEPKRMALFLWCYALMFIVRFATITLVPLEPPAGIIALADPFTNFFYGGRFISKDLFFSGHTCTMFLMFFCFPKKRDKVIALTAAFLIGIAVLVQHVHYSIDVVAAPVFAYTIYLAARRIVLNN